MQANRDWQVKSETYISTNILAKIGRQTDEQRERNEVTDNKQYQSNK